MFSAKKKTVEIFFLIKNLISSSETVRFEDWLLSHYSSLLNGSSEPDSLIYSIYENPDEPRRLFVGGYESSTFNFLETSAAAHDLRTPILGCQIADSLGKLPEGTPDSAYFDRKYKRSVMNWVRRLDSFG